MIQGVREGSRLLHIIAEDMLYVLKNKRNGNEEYICYENILVAPKKKNKTKANNSEKCTARVRILSDGTCERMGVVGHSCHPNHASVRRDLQKSTNMKKNCQYLRDHFPEDAYRISNRHIFQREIAKYCIYFTWHFTR